MLECCRQDTKEAMIFIDNKKGLNKSLTFIDLIIIFRTFPRERLMFNIHILNWGEVRLPISHTLT